MNNKQQIEEEVILCLERVVQMTDDSLKAFEIMRIIYQKEGGKDGK